MMIIPHSLMEPSSDTLFRTDFDNHPSKGNNNNNNTNDDGSEEQSRKRKESFDLNRNLSTSAVFGMENMNYCHYPLAGKNGDSYDSGYAHSSASLISSTTATTAMARKRTKKTSEHHYAPLSPYSPEDVIVAKDDVNVKYSFDPLLPSNSVAPESLFNPWEQRYFSDFLNTLIVDCNDLEGFEEGEKDASSSSGNSVNVVKSPFINNTTIWSPIISGNNNQVEENHSNASSSSSATTTTTTTTSCHKGVNLDFGTSEFNSFIQQPHLPFAISSVSPTLNTIDSVSTSISSASTATNSTSTRTEKSRSGHRYRNHIASEQKRRMSIKSTFEELVQLIPMPENIHKSKCKVLFSGKKTP